MTCFERREGVSIAAAPLLLILLGALLIRLLFFTGLSLGDDTIYLSESCALAAGVGWPPSMTHWATRLGMTLPLAILITIAGVRLWVLAAIPLACGMAKIIACWFVLKRSHGAAIANVGALLVSVVPVDVIYSTHYFPDLPVSLWSALGVLCWIEGMRKTSRGWCLAAGCVASIGYFWRETIGMDAPVYLVLWLAFSRRWGDLCALAIAPTATIVAEGCLYYLAAGDFMCRWHAIVAQQTKPENIALIHASSAGGDFWTDPIMLAGSSHEFGFMFLCALPLAVVGLRRWPAIRPFSIWLLAGYLWLAYGTASPRGWLTLQRDPRYFAALTVPAVAVVAFALSRCSRLVSLVALSFLVLSSVLAASLDQGRSVLRPHAAFLASPYAAQDTVLEPFEYVGALLSAAPDHPIVPACASDLGRMGVVHGISTIPAVHSLPISEARYVVFSAPRRPELKHDLEQSGWRQIASFPGHASFGRQLVGRILVCVPSQRQRAAQLLEPPGLVVYEIGNALDVSRDQESVDR